MPQRKVVVIKRNRKRTQSTHLSIPSAILDSAGGFELFSDIDIWYGINESGGIEWDEEEDDDDE